MYAPCCFRRSIQAVCCNPGWDLQRGKRTASWVAPENTFWQAESDHHWVRDEREYPRIVAYIENNLVKASLEQPPEDYFWSSASTAERAST